MNTKLQIAVQLGEQLFGTLRSNQQDNIIQIKLLLEESDTDDEELLGAIAIAYSRERPTRINKFVERIVTNYNNDEFQQNFRMTSSAFEFLMEKLTPLLNDSCDAAHMSIPLNKQVLSVIWLLANQESYRSVGERFDMAKSTLSKVFFRVVDCLNKLSCDIISWPSIEEMRATSIYIEETTKIKKVIGAIDGTYVAVKAPSDQKEAYTNRKMFTSVTLQAICNHKMEFINCFAGFPSSAHDRRVFNNSGIYRDITENPSLFFPNGERILGDKAYPHLKYCLVPFIDRGNLSDVDKHFNKVHAAARQVIERSFALLFGRFRRLKYIEMNAFYLVPYTILAACVLHNVCLKFPDSRVDTYLDEGLSDVRRNETQNSDNSYAQMSQETTTRDVEHIRKAIARELWDSRRR